MRGIPARPGLVWYYLATPVFALLDLVESVVNLFLLLLSILLPIWSLPDQILTGGTGGLPRPQALVNALLAGTALIVAFHRHQAGSVGLRARTEV